jgi:hypothetical protein
MIQPINIAVRSFVITLIKHSGLLHSVMSNTITTEDEETLSKLFLEGRKLRQWVAAERRERFIRQDENNNNNENIKEEDNSYERFGSDILARTNMLLQLASTTTPDDSRPVNMTGKKRQYNNLASTTSQTLRSSQDDPTVQAWREMFQVWKKMHAPRTNNTTQAGQTVVEMISNIVSFFCILKLILR